MKTLLTIAQQNAFLSDNWEKVTLTHKWSARGYGNSIILNDRDDQIAKHTGCGYDRFGAVLGDVISEFFPNEVHKLAEKTRNKKARKTYQQSKDFYGMFYNFETKKAWLDGACGDSSMRKILEKIGFKLVHIKSINNGNTGYDIYQLKPLKG